MFKSANVMAMVSDLERAVDFYTRVLGLKLQYQVDGHWAQVEAPGMVIGLHPGRPEGPGSGLYESLSIGFEVEDLASVVADLEARGVVFSNRASEGKANLLAKFTDPDGNPIYLFQML